MLVNPVFWQAALLGPLRGFLALFSLLTAYCAWRAWNGETRWVFWGACALGIGGGFRPDLLPVLFPLWLISAVAGTRSFKTVIAGTAIIGAITLIWVGAVTIAVGGFKQLTELNSKYLADEAGRAGSIVFGADAASVRRQLGRLVIWNALGAIGWIWAVPLAWKSAASTGARPKVSRLLFAAVWLLPGLVLQTLIHIEEPAHTLFSIPALCLLGGWAIGELSERLSGANQFSLGSVVLAAAMTVNTLLFLGFVPLPAKDSPTGGLHSLKNAAAYGVFEASIGQVRWLDDMADSTIKELQQLKPDGRPWIVVSTDDADRQEWFTNWRIVRYYAPAADFWIATDKRIAWRVQRDRLVESLGPAPEDESIIRIPVPRGGRIIWLIENGGALHRGLKGQQLVAGQRLFYTDVPADAKAFASWNYEFIPTSN
jgi:4-amino-4-deoxy-L-arabinose transferase-like glycosyltransferase